MKIKGVEFAGAIGQPGGKPPGFLPQIAFSGRSNVGKSSLINTVLGRTQNRIARVSVTPGRTQQINFFQVRALLTGDRAAEFYLVDLPGYGYAKVPEKIRKEWRPLMESYLAGTKEIRGVVQLIDARHDPTADDRKMVDYLAELQLPTLIAWTKVDKISRNERTRFLDRTVEKLGVERDQVVPVSSHTGEGKDDLLASLESLLQEDTGETP
jgi:GTP-binding protein